MVVADEGGEATGASRNLKDPRFSLLGGSYVAQRQQREALHRILPPKEDDLGASLVHLRGARCHPSIGLVVEVVLIVIGVERTLQPDARRFLARTPAKRTNRLIDKAQPLLRSVLRRELA